MPAQARLQNGLRKTWLKPASEAKISKVQFTAFTANQPKAKGEQK